MARKPLMALSVLLALLFLVNLFNPMHSNRIQHDWSRIPPAADFSILTRQKVSFTGPFPPGNAFALDLRQHDLSDQDLSQYGEALRTYASFDDGTRWPADLPAGFDPARYMALGKDPGLGVRALHAQGITGKGVRVAFLDQPLLVNHEEYTDRIEVYRELIRDWDGSQAAMHASAVMSILAGKSIGVAPDVAVTFYANQTFVGDHQPTWVYHAQAINEILDENAKLPPAQRIRVIAVSWGYDPAMAGFQEIKAAVARAKQEGVFVLTTTVEDDYPFFFYALGRDPLADPNDLRSYRPGSFWADQFRSGSIFYRNRIMVPMDSRTTASPTGTSDYVFYRIGGLSWAIPYLEGLYALGLQVKPDLTPEEFYRAAVETGLYNEYTENGMTYRLGPIVNPAALIRRLQG